MGTTLAEIKMKGWEALVKELGYSEKEIIIEVTGGQKTTSIAGAAATLNNQVIFQYVQNISVDLWIKIINTLI